MIRRPRFCELAENKVLGIEHQPHVFGVKGLFVTCRVAIKLNGHGSTGKHRLGSGKWVADMNSDTSLHMMKFNGHGLTGEHRLGSGEWVADMNSDTSLRMMRFGTSAWPNRQGLPINLESFAVGIPTAMVLIGNEHVKVTGSGSSAGQGS